MSFNRLDYDTCTYKQILKESIGPGEYQLATPHTSCEPCMSKDARMRVQQNGVNINGHPKLIDINSEILNINRDLSNCSRQKYNPKFNKDNNIERNNELLKYVECANLVSEDTKLSNPPTTLRGTGWNRWEWLPMNPQENIIEPFALRINTSNMARDNHRPRVPEPLSQDLVLPSPSDKPIETFISNVLKVPTGPPSVQWRNVEEIRKY